MRQQRKLLRMIVVAQRATVRILWFLQWTETRNDCAGLFDSCPAKMRFIHARATPMEQGTANRGDQGEQQVPH